VLKKRGTGERQKTFYAFYADTTMAGSTSATQCLPTAEPHARDSILHDEPPGTRGPTRLISAAEPRAQPSTDEVSTLTLVDEKPAKIYRALVAEDQA